MFLKLGLVGFGGPAAHIAMMEDEVVRRRGWLSRERFLDLLGATNLIPGPNSTEMAIHVGQLRAGWAGLVVAGVCFIAAGGPDRRSAAPGPTSASARCRRRAGSCTGSSPSIIAVVLQALWGLGRSATRTRRIAAVGLVALVAVAAGVHELLVLLAAGSRARRRARAPARLRASRTLAGLAAAPARARARGGGLGGAASFGLAPLFLFFLKVGSVLFGSGYVLLAFLRADLVERWGWLTEAQLLDAVAVGQVTPGPVFTTATFIGYVLGGVPGATLATVGIFLPAFVFVALTGPLVPRIRRSPVAGAFLDGVNVGVARAHGGRHRAARQGGDRRLADRHPGAGERSLADPLPRQLGVAGVGGRGGGGRAWLRSAAEPTDKEQRTTDNGPRTTGRRIGGRARSR